MSSNRTSKPINAGAMADIAFLLLVFFLVVTTMDSEKGLLVLLPPFTEETISDQARKKNVLEILVNTKDQLLVENKLMPISELKTITKKHVNNHGVDPNFSDSPDAALISIQNDRGTGYQMYMHVQNELRAAYNEMRDEYAQTHYGRSYKNLQAAEQKEVRETYPLRISEAEPVDVAQIY